MIAAVIERRTGVDVGKKFYCGVDSREEHGPAPPGCRTERSQTASGTRPALCSSSARNNTVAAAPIKEIKGVKHDEPHLTRWRRNCSYRVHVAHIGEFRALDRQREI